MSVSQSSLAALAEKSRRPIEWALRRVAGKAGATDANRAGRYPHRHLVTPINGPQGNSQTRGAARRKLALNLSGRRSGR